MANRLFLYGFIISILIVGCGKEHIPADAGAPAKPDNTFTNPLLVSGPDPWIMQKDSTYYYMNTMGDRLVMHKATRFSYLQYSYKKTIWVPPADKPYSQAISAPEIHLIQGKWYVYFTASDGVASHSRIYVIENDSPDPLVGEWNLKGKIAASTDTWAIDGTVMEYKNKLYFIWSGWQGDNDPGMQQLYIAEMSNPWTIVGDRVMISEPTYTWEKQGGQINEAPQILKNNQGNIFLIYSASSCLTDDYCLGMLSLKTGGNPLDPHDWMKSPDQIFGTNALNGAYGPGHCGFFKSPDGKQDWIIYDANSGPGGGCGVSRSPRIQRFTWNVNGTPDFGLPVSISSMIARPSGE